MSNDPNGPDPRATPGWLQRLHEEELSGFAFAFKARVLALGVVFIWVVLSSSWGRLPFLLAAIAVFFLVGWLGYATRNSRHMLAIQGVCAVVDVAIIVLATHYPETNWYDWALQSWLRRSAFLYLAAYVAASALTFSVRVVLVAGAASFVGQLASFGFVLHSAEHVDSFRGFTAPDALSLLRQLTEVQGIDPLLFMVNQLVLLAITTGLIAAAIWRARRHVERAVLAETERANLGRYFSPKIVERLASDTRGLGAGRAQDAAVMFVDVIGSTRRMEAVTPERVITVIRAFHRRIVPVVFQHDGSIDKFLGDGLMAVFGAPEKAPYAARDALFCAVEILDMIDQWKDERIDLGKAATTVGIGLHWGPVIQGNVGIADRLEFTTLGDTVNVASRLENMTREFHAGILLSREALDEAERSNPLPDEIRARCRDLGLQPIVGHEAPIHIIAIDRRPSP
ncbi:adenylate/guanylate cyclase domain-containing protein [Reyranella sp.]|uniref:adenylate/guanylate cyclase domain-containing protein n=1 Tax=Reyranella sp. TaxID=1929291 RepID=UPI003BACB73B